MGLTAWLGKLTNNNPVYVRFDRDSITLRDSGSGNQLEEVPVLAVSRSKPKRILGVGRSAEISAAETREQYELFNGFDHPRVLLDDFLAAEKVLEHLFRKLLSARIFRPSPVVVMHPLGNIEGGMTQIEIRAIRELAAGAGAREVFVWSGRPLHDEELRSGTFRKMAGVLDGKSKLES